MRSIHEDSLITLVGEHGWHWVLSTLAQECERQFAEDHLEERSWERLSDQLDAAVEAAATLGDE